MSDAEERHDPHAEQEAHGATPPHGDPLSEPHPETGGPHGSPGSTGSPSDEEDSATPPHGDPLR